MSLLEQEFHAAMVNVYHRAKTEYGYNATRFLRMLGEHRGVYTAHILLRAEGVSDGYVTLCERGGLGVTVEAVVLDPRWRTLFSPAELATARRRLLQFEFDVDALESKYEEAMCG